MSKKSELKDKSIKILEDTYIDIKKIIAIIEAENGYQKVTFDMVISKAVSEYYKNILKD